MKKLLFVFAGLAFALTAAAQEFRITHGPYLCDMWRDGVTVVWTTSRPALSWVEASPADSLAPAPPPRHYQTVAGRKLAGRTLHAVRVRGLQPGTDYRYRISSQEVQSWPDVNNVTYGKTVGADASRRRAYGFRTPSGCGFRMLVPRAERHPRQGRDGPDPALQTRGLFRTGIRGFQRRHVEQRRERGAAFQGLPRRFGRTFRRRDARFPSPAATTRRAASSPTASGITLPGGTGGPTAFIATATFCILLLDCGEDKPDDHAEYNGLADYDAYRAEECAWLKKAVRSEEFLTASARIVLLHIPPAAGAWHGSVHLNELFVPVLDGAGIDLMLCGHDHRYSFHPAGERDAKFPIVVNDNRSCVRCDVADSLIRVRIAGPRDKTVHTHEFPLKPRFRP